MTTNKPEVVAYHHINKENPEQRGVSLFHDPSCTNTLIQSEPLIRLSDYEALQAEFVIRLDELSARNYELRMGLAEKTSECEKLRKDAEPDVSELVEALERIARHPRTRGDELGYAGCRNIAKEALAAHRKGGDA